MKGSGNGNGDDLIVVRRKNDGKLVDAFRVCLRLVKADKEVFADAKDIATFESARKENVFELSETWRAPERVERRLAQAGPPFRAAGSRIARPMRWLRLMRRRC